MIREPFDLSKTVWVADLEYWITAQEIHGKAKSSWREEEGFLELNRELGVLPYYWYEDFWVAHEAYDSTIEVKSSREDGRYSRSWRTPVGTIQEEVRLMVESCSWAHVKYPVATAEDLRVLLYLTEHSNLQLCEHIERYQKRADLWAEYGGVPALALPRCALSAFFYQWAGMLQGVYLMVDEPEITQELFSLYDAREESILAALSQLGPKVIHFADNISSDNMTGYFDQYMKQTYTKRLSVLHEAGICCAVHLDGVIDGMLQKLSAVGMDAIEALTPSPAGDLTPDQIRDRAGRDDLVLWGGLPGLLFSPSYSQEELLSYVKDLLDSWKRVPHVIGVADQVPADGQIEKVRAISNLIEAYDSTRGVSHG